MSLNILACEVDLRGDGVWKIFDGPRLYYFKFIGGPCSLKLWDALIVSRLCWEI